MQTHGVTSKTSKNEAKPLGPTIAKIMARREYKQNELSRELGMTPSQISNFLSGQRDIRSSTFVSLLKVLGIDLVKVLRSQAGQGSSMIENLESQLQVLPEIERDTLADFIRVYQHRYVEERNMIKRKAHTRA